MSFLKVERISDSFRDTVKKLKSILLNSSGFVFFDSIFRIFSREQFTPECGVFYMTQNRKEEYFERLKDIEEINVFSPVMIKIREVANNPRSSATDLANVILRDHTLGSKVLKLANSVYYSPGNKKISTMTQAVVTLGFEEVKQLAFSISLFDSFRGNMSENFKYEHFWAHSLAVAICAHRFANVIWRDRQEEAFVAGFLHDLGKLVIGRYTPEDWDIIIDKSKKGFTARQAEFQQIGTYHTEVGAFVARKWNFPSELIDAMKGHHTPTLQYKSNDKVTISDIVYLANLFGNLIYRSPLGIFRSHDEIKNEASRLFNFSGLTFGRILQSVRKSVIETAEDLAIVLSQPIKIEDIPDDISREEMEKQFKQLQLSFQRKCVELNVIQRMSLNLLQATDQNELYTMICIDLVDGGLFDRAIIFKVNWKNGTIEGLSSRGLKKRDWLAKYRLDWGDENGVLGQVIQEGTFLHIDQEETDEEQPSFSQDLIEKLGLNVFGCLPIAIRDRVEAVLLVDNNLGEQPLTEDMIETVSQFTRQIGLLAGRLFTEDSI